MIKNFFALLLKGFLLGTGFLGALFGFVGIVTFVLIKALDSDEPLPPLSHGAAERKVAVLDISGEIFETRAFRRQLEKQLADPSVKGIVVAIDSPGGAVGASEELFRLIQGAATKKPVTCAMGSSGASGGLYAAMGCRKIVANNSTFTGSIGVIAMIPNFSSVLNRFDIQFTILKSGALKDAGSPLRPMEGSERAFLQSLINKSYEQFVQVIAESRNLPIETVRAFADGRILLGEEAVKLKLVDEIGGIERAAKLALALAQPEKGEEQEPYLTYPAEKETFFERALRLEESAAIQLLKTVLVPRPVIRYQAFL